MTKKTHNTHIFYPGNPNEKPTFLEHIDILFSYSFRIKGYMPNLG
jgi:hypothetical protein